MPDDQIQSATEDPEIGGLLHEIQGRFGQAHNLYENAANYARQGDAANWRFAVSGALDDGAALLQHLQANQPAAPQAAAPATPGSLKAELASASAGMAAIKDNLLRLLAPAAREGAKPGALSVRHRAAELAHIQAQTEKALEAAGKALKRLPVQDRWDFYDRIERGDAEPDPVLQGNAGIFRQVLDSARADVQSLGTGKLQAFIENYLPHFYKDADKAAQSFAQAGLSLRDGAIRAATSTEVPVLDEYEFPPYIGEQQK